MKRPKKARSKKSKYVLLSSVELPHTLEVAVQDYYDWSDKHFRTIESRRRSTDPLYHYTDMNGFAGILSSKQIWFTDYRHLNDQTELVHGIGIAKAMLAKRFEEGLLGGFLFRWIDDLLRKRNFGLMAFFIASFSRNGNDLGQWRAYADDGRGVAIRFSSKLFEANQAIDPDPRRNTFVGPVRYKDEQTRKRHANGFDKAAWVANTATRYARRHLRDKAIGMEFLNRLARAVIASPVIWNALTCKHHSYQHEAEVRLVILGLASKFKRKVSTRKRNGRVVRYIKYDLPLSEPNMIAEIVIGPAAPANAERLIKSHLQNAGIKYNVKIRRSRIPYRSFRP
jgi:Protein of unknown function (DUF2971)